MKPTDNQVPYYKRPDRKKTDHAEAVRLMERGWSWGKRKFACRDDWEAAVLGYHGIFTLPSDNLLTTESDSR